MTYDHAYQRLLLALLTEGQRRPTRAVLPSTGAHVDALTLFAPPPLVVDLSAGFPLLTLRKVSLKVTAAELLWFLSGSTNASDLRALGANIWDEWAADDGALGPVYGAQWRAFHGRDGRVVDQIESLIGRLQATVADPYHPDARRLMLTGYNPADAIVAALPPCHVLAQWDVDPDARTLSCLVTQRSADVYLGLPYNVASYALLTHLLAEVAGLGVGRLVMSLGNAHLYSNHVDQARELLARRATPAPRLVVGHRDAAGLAYSRLSWVDGALVLGCALPAVTTTVPLAPEHLRVTGYQPGEALPGEVAVLPARLALAPSGPSARVRAGVAGWPWVRRQPT